MGSHSTEAASPGRPLIGGATLPHCDIAQYGAFTTPLAIVWALCLAVAIWRQPSIDAA
jgi:hypothetical protein